MTTDRLDPKLVKIFETELFFQVRQVMRSAGPVETYINMRGPGGDMEAFWYSMNAALNAMASIGNILWPAQDWKHKGIGGSRSSSKLRGKLLREELGVSDASVLTLHDVRNGFAHFDERIDRWFVQSENKTLVDLSIGGNNGWRGVPDTAFARFFNPETGIVSVFGVSLDLQAAYEEVGRLGLLLQERQRHGPVADVVARHFAT